MGVTAFLVVLIYLISMRGDDQRQSAMFSYLTLAQDVYKRQVRRGFARALCVEGLAKRELVIRGCTGAEILQRTNTLRKKRGV